MPQKINKNLIGAVLVFCIVYFSTLSSTDAPVEIEKEEEIVFRRNISEKGGVAVLVETRSHYMTKAIVGDFIQVCEDF